jgi:hypothetical protein
MSYFLSYYFKTMHLVFLKLFWFEINYFKYMFLDDN